MATLLGVDAEPQPWTQLSRVDRYENPWMHVTEDQVRLPNGKTTMYGIVHLGECVGMLPFVSDDEVLLVQQYRYVEGRNRWEMPTGGMEEGESPEDAAQRELAEEAGFRAGRLDRLPTIHTSKSVCEETAYIYAARDLEPHELPPDDTEFIRRRIFAFDDVVDMVLSGEIVDGMTVVAVLAVARERAVS